VAKSQNALDDAIRRGKPAVAEDPFTICRSPEVDIVVDVTGSESGLPTALGIVRPRGTVVQKTTVAGRQTMAWAPIVIDEITLVGSRCGPFDRALDALAHGELDVSGLVSSRFDLSKGLEALEQAGSQPVLKVLLDVA
jgi:threonine dehydrogenase-like Zn-dependent dehydrogenase